MGKRYIVISVLCCVCAIWGSSELIAQDARANRSPDPDVWQKFEDMTPYEKKKVENLANEYMRYIDAICEEINASPYEGQLRNCGWKLADFGRLKNGLILQAWYRIDDGIELIVGGAYRTLSDFFDSPLKAKKALMHFSHRLDGVIVYFTNDKGEDLGSLVMAQGEIHATQISRAIIRKL